MHEQLYQHKCNYLNNEKEPTSFRPKDDI